MLVDAGGSVPFPFGGLCFWKSCGWLTSRIDICCCITGSFCALEFFVLPCFCACISAVSTDVC
jgi:hypothetical protein